MTNRFYREGMKIREYTDWGAKTIATSDDPETADRIIRDLNALYNLRLILQEKDG